MFVNLTNHPFKNWSLKQLEAAQKFGEIIDLPFPEVSPSATSEELVKMAEDFVEHIISLLPGAVLCQGEFTLAFCIVSLLLKRNITVLAACSERNVSETIESDGTSKKITHFDFVQFRKYSF